MTPQTRTTAGILFAIAAIPFATLLLSSGAGSGGGGARGFGAAGATPPAGRPALAAAAPAGVTARAQLRSSHVLVGESETFVAVTVTAPDVERRARPPLNLAIVIDRSGSMSGEKLEHAKEAARELVGALTERDRVALVAYGSDVSIPLASAVADETGRRAALAAIDGIHDDGGTNLSGGLEHGRDQVLPFHQSGAVSRIVLISDGMANEGVVDAGALSALAAATAERGVSLTTVGVGLDFDERVMTRLAVAGSGNYYFVEHADQLAGLFASELGKLGNVVATELDLEVTPAEGVQVLEAYGYDLERQGDRQRVTLADLHAGETRKVVLRVAVSAPAPGSIDVASFQLGYRPVTQDGSSDRLALVEFASRGEATASRADVEDHLEEDAVRHIERARTAAALEKATEYYERGDVARARETLAQQASDMSVYESKGWGTSLRTELAPVMAEAEADFDQADKQRGGSVDKRARKASRRKAYDLAR